MSKDTLERLEQEERQQRIAQLRSAYEDTALRKVLMTEEGRAIIWLIIRDSNALQKTGSGEGLEYRSGRHDLGCEIQDLVLGILPDPDRLRREALERESFYEAQAGGAFDLAIEAE